MDEMTNVEIEGLRLVGDAPKNEDEDDTRTVETEKVMFKGLKERHEDAPEPRPYRFNADQLRDLQVALALKTNVLITGPTGCGKTSLPIALAALLGIPVIRFNCNGETRVSGMIGMQKPAAKDGVLTLQSSLSASMPQGTLTLTRSISSIRSG